MWAGTAAGALGLSRQVDPETYRALFGKLTAPTGERLYSGRPPRYAGEPGRDKDEEAAAPFYDLTFSATKSVSLLQASYAAARARERGDTVYRHQIRPVVQGGAEVMDQLFPRRDGDA